MCSNMSFCLQMIFHCLNVYMFKLGAYKQYSQLWLYSHTCVTLLNLICPQCSGCGVVSLLFAGYIRALNAGADWI